MPSFTRTAGGDIYPMRFVTIDLTVANSFRVVQATAGSGSHGDPPYGISQRGQRRIDYVSSDGKAAILGEDLQIYGPPDKDVLLMVNGTVTQGDMLKSDSTGMGVSTTTAADWIGAIAMANGVAGQAIPVQCVGPHLYS
jgi:hypothetical protein